MPYRVWLSFVAFALLAAAIVSGCGPKHEEQIRPVLQQIWEAKLRGDCGVEYDHGTKASQQELARETYTKRCNTPVKSYSLDNIEMVDATTAKVTVNYVINPMGFTFELKHHSDWKLEDGAWRVVLKKGSKLPMQPSNDPPVGPGEYTPAPSAPTSNATGPQTDTPQAPAEPQAATPQVPGNATEPQTPPPAQPPAPKAATPAPEVPAQAPAGAPPSRRSDAVLTPGSGSPAQIR